MEFNPFSVFYVTDHETAFCQVHFLLGGGFVCETADDFERALIELNPEFVVLEGGAVYAR